MRLMRGDFVTVIGASGTVTVEVLDLIEPEEYGALRGVFHSLAVDQVARLGDVNKNFLVMHNDGGWLDMNREHLKITTAEKSRGAS